MDEKRSDNITDVIDKETSQTLPEERRDLMVSYREVEPESEFHPLLKPKRIKIRATIIHDNDKS